MELVLRKGDLLSAPAEALVLPISNNGRADRIGGRTCLLLGRRLPEAWDECVDSVEAPLALGQPQLVGLSDVESGPFRAALLVSCRHYAPDIPFTAAVGFMRSSLSRALSLARSEGLESVAAPLLKSGTRTAWSEAFCAMLDVLEQGRSISGRLTLWEWRDDYFENLAGLARTLQVPVEE
jgi:hypothetical protein